MVGRLNLGSVLGAKEGICQFNAWTVQYRPLFTSAMEYRVATVEPATHQLRGALSGNPASGGMLRERILAFAQ